MRDDVKQAPGIQTENPFDRTVIFYAGHGVGLVVIHVTGRNHQNTLALRGDDIGHGLAKLFQNVELCHPESDWHEVPTEILTAEGFGKPPAQTSGES